MSLKSGFFFGLGEPATGELNSRRLIISCLEPSGASHSIKHSTTDNLPKINVLIKKKFSIFFLS